MASAFLPPPLAPPRRARPQRARIIPSCTSRPCRSLVPASAAAAILLTTQLNGALAAASEPVFAAPQVESAVSQVSDPARVLTSGQAARLLAQLRSLEESTGVRVVVVTRGAALAPLPLPAPRTVVVALDPRAGNVLSFSVAPDLAPVLPASFFIEATNRFGNTFYVRDNGLDAALLSAVQAIETCASSARVCRAVPGVSDDQWVISVSSAAVAGTIAGAAARTGGKKFNASFLLLFSPLWSICLISFGIGPIVARGPGVELQLATTISAFVVLALTVWAWVPISLGPPGEGGSAES